MSGIYNFEAVTLALSNAFRKKGHQAQEYRKEPLLKDWKTRPLTEEEKIAATDKLFEQLEMMQRNFELDKKQSGAG